MAFNMTGKIMKDETVAIDSVRSVDNNGFLHVAESPLTKETVNPYRGREIPGWEELGLDPQHIYQGYRSGAELKKAVQTFNGIPLLLEHKLDSAATPLKEERVGSIGTNALWTPPYIFNAITVTDKYAIGLIESGAQKELSACYRYKPVFEQGTFDGVSYDFIMTDIEANHVAIVDEGRAGADVYVYDRSLTGKNITDTDTISKENNMPKKVEELRQAAKGFMDALNAFLDEEGKEAEHAGDEGETSTPKEANNAKEGAKDEDAGKKTGCDSEDEGGQKDFAEGVKYGESKEKEEPKKLDKEHESAGMKKAMDEDKKEEHAAADRKLAFDKAIERAEERGAAKAVAKVKSLYEAADAVRGTIKVKALAYDSEADIYAAALKQEGVSTAAVDKAAFRSLYLAIAKDRRQNSFSVHAADSAKVEETPFSKNVKVEE